MNADELSSQLDEKYRQIIRAGEALSDVQKEIYLLKKKLVELIEVQRQAKFNISRMKLEKELITREFWRVRNG